ncbi:MAG: hypothetical protein JJ863_00690 [Deltaproteobacteria bacterium]|nr:hypothetical protein [Deltaproteobacteria bacterium]
MDTRDTVRAIVAELATVPDDDESPIDVESLVRIQIIEAVEDAFDLIVSADDLTPERFASVASIAAFVEEKNDA